jgi:hypothetical protein
VGKKERRKNGSRNKGEKIERERKRRHKELNE